MENLDLGLLHEAYIARLQSVNTDYVRYLYNVINWDARIIGIKGARGVGKTTLLIQRIKLTCEGDYTKAFYASLDNLWFNEHSLLDLVRYLCDMGIKHLYLDEVHKYPNWVQTLKNISDIYPSMNIVYTGSSLLEIDHSKADLSRRQTLYTLRCMSFREYLEYEGICVLPSISLENILRDHIKIAMDITSGLDILKHFSDYLHHGVYPYYKETGADFMLRLRETVKLVIDNDVPAVESFEYQTLEKMKKLLMIMAKSVPFMPNVNFLCQEISTNRNLGIKLLYLLDRANILKVVTPNLKSFRNLTKPEKVLFNNTNLMYAFCTNPKTGTLRETFFANQLEYTKTIVASERGDFLVDEQYLFEVGGRNKSFNQIKDVPDSFLAIDDTTVGYGNRIPIWLFGMMY